MLCAVALVCTFCDGRIGRVWGEDAAALRAAFRNPPPTFRHLVIMHSSPLRMADAPSWPEARRAGGAVIDGGVRPGSKDVGDEPWNNPTYLDDPGQFARLRETVERWRNQGLCVWLYDELGYPSCSAGGRVLEGHPEFQVEDYAACSDFAGRLACLTRRGRHVADVAVLILPDMRMVQRGTLDQVRTFLKSGGNVVLIGTLPCQSTERGDDSSLAEEATAMLAAFPDQTRHEDHTRSLRDVIRWIDQRVPRLVRWEGPAGVRLLHRQEPGRAFVLVANPGPGIAEGTVTTPCPGTASLWDPETGEPQIIGPLEQGSAVPLSVPAASARFLVVEP